MHEQNSSSQAPKSGPIGPRLVEELRNLIVTGEVAPGEVLAELRVAERFGISKTPVREALHLLAAEGLITVLPKKGYLVRPMTSQDLREVTDVRMLLEPHAASEAARFADGEAVARMKALVDLQREASETDPVKAMHYAREFHGAIAVASRNSRISAQLLRCFDETARAHYVIPELQAHMHNDDELAEHEAIMDAISRGDAEAALEATKKHLRTIRSVTTQRLERGSALWQ